MTEEDDRIYVAHCISAPTEEGVQDNINEVLRISRYMHLEEVIPEAPYIYRLNYLDDSSPEERKLGIEANLKYFEEGNFLDGLVVTGPTVLDSEGTKAEIDLAVENEIPVGVYNPKEFEEEDIVRDYNPNLDEELEEYLSEAEYEVPDRPVIDPTG